MFFADVYPEMQWVLRPNRCTTCRRYCGAHMISYPPPLSTTNTTYQSYLLHRVKTRKRLGNRGRARSPRYVTSSPTYAQAPSPERIAIFVQWLIELLSASPPQAYRQNTNLLPYPELDPHQPIGKFLHDLT